jgi:hypothetical protein
MSLAPLLSSVTTQKLVVLSTPLLHKIIRLNFTPSDLSSNATQLSSLRQIGAGENAGVTAGGRKN